MAEEITCFISFCEADGNVAELAVLVAELQALTDRKVKFLCSYELEAGGDIRAHEAKLDSMTDACLVIGTPEYKKRVDDREFHTGVYREFQTIMKRFDEANETRVNGDEYSPLKVIPIIWRGSFEKSIPTWFYGGNKASNLSQFLTYSTDNGSRRLSTEARNHVTETLKDIADTLLALSHVRLTPPKSREEIYSRFDLTPPESRNLSLFNTQKREGELTSTFQDDLFVKTRQFTRVINQDDFILVGRKGVGKTTLISSMTDKDKHPAPIEAIVDSWKIHSISINQYDHTVSSDFRFVKKNRTEAFKLIWAGLIFMEVQRSEAQILEQRIDERPLRPEALNYLRIEVAGGLSSQFILASELAEKYIQFVIDSAPDNSIQRFEVFLNDRMNVDHFLLWLAGGEAPLTQALISASRHHHLFCLDGFDSEFQRARTDALVSGKQHQQLIVHTEIDWLTALIEVLEAIKKPRTRNGMKSLARLKSLDICVALPTDRFMEMQDKRRDSIIAGSTRDIRWTGIELVNLLRKRVEKSGNFNTKSLKNEGKSPVERFFYGIKKYAKELDTTLSVTIGTKSFEYDLFIEVLRHTLWRPRDVLIHYAEILAVLKENRIVKREMIPIILSTVISNSTHIIIEHEWIGEIKDYINNIKEIIGSFQNGDQILEYDHVIYKLSSVDFLFSYARSNITPHEKLKILFELGFFGTRKKQNYAGGRRRMKDIFYHIYPEIPDFADTELGRSLLLLIHPLFIERLNLIPNGDEPVMNFNWDEIEVHDAVAK